MRYIDDIELEIKNNKYEIKQINFRSTFYCEFEELYKKGPITYDINDKEITASIRYSEYLPMKVVMQYLYRLNEYYEVNFYKVKYYKETQKVTFTALKKDNVLIRIFPLSH